MSEDLDARIARFRQRNQQDRGSLSEDVVRAKSQVAEHAAALADALDRRIVAAESRADEVAAKVSAMGGVMIRVGAEITSLEERLSVERARLEQLRAWAFASFGVAVLAAVVIVALAAWVAVRMHAAAEGEAGRIRAASAVEIEVARRTGEEALAGLNEELASERLRIEAGIEEAGADLARLAADRDAMRADLARFADLRQRAGIDLIDYRGRPIIVVPEGMAISPWGAPGLSDIARFNGRMFRVVASER